MQHVITAFPVDCRCVLNDMVATYNVSYSIRNDSDEFSWTRNTRCLKKLFHFKNSQVFLMHLYFFHLWRYGSQHAGHILNLDLKYLCMVSLLRFSWISHIFVSTVWFPQWQHILHIILGLREVLWSGHVVWQKCGRGSVPNINPII